MNAISSKLSATGLCFIMSAAPMNAIEIFGFKFFESDEPETVELISPLNYDLTWTVQGDDVNLKTNIKRASALIRDMDQPASGRAGLLSAANGDYQLLVETLYARGYYAGRVSITLNGAEASDLPLDVQLPDPTPVVISIDPGPVYTFRTAEINNLLPGTNLDDFGFAPGLTANSNAVRDAGRAAVKEWAKQGHALADIPDADVVADHSARKLDVSLDVVSGPKVVYGPVSVT